MSNWTIESYVAHNEALRLAEEKFQAERDRRYTEVALERAMALSIQKKADEVALGLQRDYQIYKDEKANELRSQIERERGSYVTQTELRAAVDKLVATLEPIRAYVSTQQGGSKGMRDMYGWIVAGLLALVTIFSLFVK